MNKVVIVTRNGRTSVEVDGVMIKDCVALSIEYVVGVSPLMKMTIRALDSAVSADHAKVETSNTRALAHTASPETPAAPAWWGCELDARFPPSEVTSTPMFPPVVEGR